jgi:hypothetical protein
MTRLYPIGFHKPACLAILTLIGFCALPVMGQQPVLRDELTPVKHPAATGRSDATPPLKPDVSASEPRQFRVIRLKFANPQEVVKVIGVTLLEDHNVRIAVDTRTNSILMSATKEQFRFALDIIQEMDVPPSPPDAKPRSAPVDVRVIWLAEGDANAAKPAEDLKGVVDELHRLGLNKVGQVAQVLVKSQVGGRNFHIACSPLLEGKPTQLTAQGQILEDLTGEISITATRRRDETKGAVSPNEPTERLAQIDLNIDMKKAYRENQYIVLAVAPIGKITSVFVLQITPY